MGNFTGKIITFHWANITISQLIGLCACMHVCVFFKNFFLSVVCIYPSVCGFYRVSVNKDWYMISFVKICICLLKTSRLPHFNNALYFQPMTRFRCANQPCSRWLERSLVHSCVLPAVERTGNLSQPSSVSAAEFPSVARRVRSPVPSHASAAVSHLPIHAIICLEHLVTFRRLKRFDSNLAVRKTNKQTKVRI